MLSATAIGFIGQGFFAARVLLQWIKSERAKRTVLPRGYWHLSLLGALFALAYGIMRRDLVYLTVVVPNTFIYARNLFVTKPASPRQLWPVAIMLVGIAVYGAFAKPYLGNPVGVVSGIAGSIIFSSRFIIQWWISERRGESQLPLAFWIMSLAGCPLLLVYGIAREDPVLIVGFSLSALPYIRNLRLIRKAARGAKESSAAKDA